MVLHGLFLHRHHHIHRDDGVISTRSCSPGELPHYLLEFVILFLEVGFKSFRRGVALLLLAKGFEIVGWKGFTMRVARVVLFLGWPKASRSGDWGSSHRR